MEAFSQQIKPVFLTIVTFYALCYLGTVQGCFEKNNPGDGENVTIIRCNLDITYCEKKASFRVICFKPITSILVTCLWRDGLFICITRESSTYCSVKNDSLTLSIGTFLRDCNLQYEETPLLQCFVQTRTVDGSPDSENSSRVVTRPSNSGPESTDSGPESTDSGVSRLGTVKNAFEWLAVAFSIALAVWMLCCCAVDAADKRASRY